MTGHLQPRTALAAPAFRVDQSAQILETVGCDESGGGELPKRLFDLAGELARSLDQLRQEGGAAAVEGVGNLAAGLGQAISMSR